MHLPLLLLVGSLIAQPAPAQSSAAKAGADHRTGELYPGTSHGYGRSDGVRPGTGDQGPSFDYAPAPESGWGFDGALGVPQGQMRYPSPGDPDYGAPPDKGVTVRPLSGGGPARPGGRSGPWTGHGNEGFRFRGDKEPREGAWAESAFAPGFKFRPLTPAELERSSASDGWRPLGREEGRPPEPLEPSQERTDTFGYEADSWFRKYYGDRP